MLRSSARPKAIEAAKSYGPFAASIAFGLLFAMIGTLFVVPLSYSGLAVADERMRELWARLRPKTGGPGGQLGAAAPDIGQRI